MAQVFDLHALKAFAPGQSTVMHSHPKEEEAIFKDG
jgi:quercetin dioxygenase-like cupin family protein